jgi:hypothetical protein
MYVSKQVKIGPAQSTGRMSCRLAKDPVSKGLAGKPSGAPMQRPSRDYMAGAAGKLDKIMGGVLAGPVENAAKCWPGSRRHPKINFTIVSKSRELPSAARADTAT